MAVPETLHGMNNVWLSPATRGDEGLVEEEMVSKSEQVVLIQCSWARTRVGSFLHENSLFGTASFSRLQLGEEVHRTTR